MLGSEPHTVNSTACTKGYGPTPRRSDPGATVDGSGDGLLSIHRPPSARMKQLIVNADDFGLTESVNRGVLEAHRQGILTSATLMTNGAAFESAVALARAAPRLGVGVHLNLSEGRPVSEPGSVPSLVDERGAFYGSPARLLPRILLGELRLEEVERECRAQIERACRAGIEVTHLDSHKHVHMLPPIFPVVLRLAREYGIGVRLGIERPIGFGRLLGRNGGAAGQLLKQYAAARALAALAIHFHEQLEQAAVQAPAHFYGIVQTGFLDRAELEAILWNLPEGSSELMCHPGYVDGALGQTPTRLVGQREKELEALTDPEIRNLVAFLSIQLIDYRHLAAAR